jgi:REP element-mobilizing transposase RayT
MPFDANKHHRRSIRLLNHDYTQDGAYFVTICTHQRACMFGEITDIGEMVLNAPGQIVEDEWLQTALLRPSLELDAFVIMPNHIHGILVINDMGGVVGARRALPLQERPSSEVTFGKPAARSLGIIVGAFKSAVSKRINEWRNAPGMPIWQRNFHEKIIRNESMLNALRQYVENNPANWAFDEDNPIKRKA